MSNVHRFVALLASLSLLQFSQGRGVAACGDPAHTHPASSGMAMTHADAAGEDVVGDSPAGHDADCCAEAHPAPCEDAPGAPCLTMMACAAAVFIFPAPSPLASPEEAASTISRDAPALTTRAVLPELPPPRA